MRILIIQTAFLGDVVLATPLIEKLNSVFPNAQLDFLLRKGNESLLKDHPHLRKLWIFDKKNGKYRQLWRLVQQIRKERYDYAINLQRFATSGLLTAFSGAKHTIGFAKNPLSFLFSRRFPHEITQDGTVHEVERNLSLLSGWCDTDYVGPRLYPSAADLAKVQQDSPYLCLAPASIWYTKQLPAAQWVRLIRHYRGQYKIFLLGAPSDHALCDKIKTEAGTGDVHNLAGELNLLQSAALMRSARMNFVNDSAPLHLASSMNAPVVAFFCSTVPGFGFGPLSEQSWIFEHDTPLTCRPCGLHGKRTCPEGHFKCSEIPIELRLAELPI